MNALFLVIAVLIPFGGGAVLFGAKKWNYKTIMIYSEILTILTSVLVGMLVFQRPQDGLTIFELVGNLKIMLKLDGLGSVFAGLVALLWPLANLYAFSYMKHDKERKHTFFGFYIMTYGVTLGIAFAGNILTLYFFYEMLTLVTFYLVMHPMTKKAIRASRMYLYFSLGGAAFAFLSIICLVIFGDTSNFVLGGVLDMSLVSHHPNQVLFMFVLAFCGFGVKAALFPFHGWLLKASVAPTPVTALLHAVAVVKAGTFATIRIIYYSYGADFLRGTWAQKVVLVLAMITIIYGSTMAAKERHIKRRLAYSTISNLSYILLGATIMTPLGMIGALTHLVMHAVMKICGFFCVGAVMHETGKNYIEEIEGLGRKMPLIFGCLTVAGISLAGIPPFSGFISKWNLAAAGLQSENILGVIGVGVLLYSAFMTVIYMGTMLIRAWFPRKNAGGSGAKEVVMTVTDETVAKDPEWLMKLPVMIFAVMIIAMGIGFEPIVSLITAVAYGIF